MKPGASNQEWISANQKCLMAELGLVRAAILAASGQSDSAIAEPHTLEAAFQESRAEHTAPSALDRLSSILCLTTFERSVLLLCAGIELDSSFALECGNAQRGRQSPLPTFSLALGALPGAHWSALAPNSPLRYWRLLEVGAGLAITTSPLRIDERILHFLAGVPGVDERLFGFLETIETADVLTPTHEAVAQGILETWLRASGNSEALSSTERAPLVQICGRDILNKRQVAAAACAYAGYTLWRLPVDRMPQTVPELDVLQRYWEREAALSEGALLIESSPLDEGDSARMSIVRQWIERSRSPLLLSTLEPVRGILRAGANFEVSRPTASEQRRVWEQTLGNAAARLNGHLDRIVSYFDLTSSAIRAACARASSGMDWPGAAPLETDETDAPSALWEACRAQSRVKLDDLAQRISSDVTWEDLVLPDRTAALLRQILIHVEHRATVYERWGFAARSSRGLGLSAIFCGPSGTGKTLAAEVLANELKLDLYRVDLSQLVSKYIGETEKNLRRVFDAAEESGAVLLFDEADALFGKRSEVKDSHDRYANIEVSYLLQRMEAYRGLAILTTNMKEILDPAFLRRIRFIVQFPFPDAALRGDIWRRIFPEALPCRELDLERLSSLNLAGGNIRNIALNAAFLAAEAREPVCMDHVLRAARTELAKLEKPLPEAEFEAWR